MHLAIVGPYPPNITGISQYGYHISQSLAQSGQFTRITVMADTPIVPQLIDTPAPIQTEHVWQQDRLNIVWKIVRYLRHLKPDLVWFNVDVGEFVRSPLAYISAF